MTAVLRPVPAEPHIPAKPGAVAPSGGIRRARHFLLLPGDVDVEEVELLAQSRFPAAAWEPHPRADHGPQGALEPGALRISRHTVVVGPYSRGDNTGGCLLDVVCPRERGEPPFPGIPDPDGSLAAFPKGLPVRDEGRVVAWLLAVGRRLGATVVLDATEVVIPDPDAQFDLTVYSGVWLAPEAALATVKTVEPRAGFAPGGREWAGPPPDIASRALPPGVDLPPEVREALHAAADDVDMAALSAEPQLSGYAIHLDLDIDGLIAVEIGGEEVLPTSLQGLPWADAGAVAYRVRWFPHEDDDHADDGAGNLHQGAVHHSLGFRVSRGRAAARVEGITRALFTVTGGEVLDEDDFLIHPEDL